MIDMLVQVHASQADQEVVTQPCLAIPGARDDVSFGVLGPLTVHLGRSDLKIGSPKIRTLLAALLLRMGRPLTIYELSEAVWGYGLPANPRRAIQLCATRLRSQLFEAGVAHLLVTCPDGYLLNVAPQYIDIGRFDAFLATADRAAANGDAVAESNALADALAQWRGEPLADIPSDKLQREVTPRLRERRLQALERRIDADLRRGLHADLIAELFELTSQHPTRERLWVRLMTALHRTGRRAEALEAYRSVRAYLAEELGIDPGEELRQLHASIFSGSQSHGHRLVSVARHKETRNWIGPRIGMMSTHYES